MANDPVPAPNALHARLESDSKDLACDHLRISTVTGTEAISTLFKFVIEVACLEPDEFHAAKVIGASATLVFEVDDEPVRKIHGMIAEVEQVFQSDSAAVTVYRLLLVPRLYRLSLIETQEVFLNVAIPEIAQTKLRRVGLSAPNDVAFNLMGGYFPTPPPPSTWPYPARQFVIQFLETDLAFISRLTEALGISFFFDHSGATDKVVFVDSTYGFTPVKGHESAQVHLGGEHHGVYALRRQSRVMPKKWIIQDYNHRTPHIDLTGTYDAPDGLAGGVVEYGPNILSPAEGKALARVRSEERDALYHPYLGQSDVLNFTAGAQVKLEGSLAVPDLTIVITQVHHTFQQPSPLLDAIEGEPYKNTFSALDTSMTYRPPRVTKKPRIFGVLPARVEPPRAARFTSGEPANDANGDYTIRFHFDTSALNTRMACSLPVRMIQALSGPGYGMHFPLRPGIEVSVVFIDGNPDRPLIVGGVPNTLVRHPLPGPSSQFSVMSFVSGPSITVKDSSTG